MAADFTTMALPQQPIDLTGRTILQVVPELDIGGAEATTVEVSEAIIAAGGTALVASQGGRLVDQLTALGARILILPVASKNPVIMWRNRSHLAKIITDYQVDIIHARSRAPAWSSYFAARRTDSIYMSTYHGTVHRAPASKVFYNSVLTRGAAVIANSSYTASLIAEVHGVAAEKIKVIPRGCDVDHLARNNIDMARVVAKRTKWGVGADDFVILCPARLTEIKGQDVLLHAFAGVAAKAPEGMAVKLVFVGSTQGREAYLAGLKDLVSHYDLHDQVVFAGLEHDMAAAYAASDAVVAPSTRTEPFGRGVIEAQAATLPVIASDAGGFRETIITGSPIEGASGWLVAPGDVAAWHQALVTLVNTNASARQKIGENGRTNACTHYTQQALCARTLSVYQQLIGPHPAAASQ